MLQTHIKHGTGHGLVRDINEPWEDYRLRLFLHTFHNLGEQLHAVTIFFNVADHTGITRDHKAFLAQAETAYDNGNVEALKEFAVSYASKN